LLSKCSLRRCVLGEPLDTVKYDPLGTFHIEAGKPGLKRHADLSKLVAEVRRFSPDVGLRTS
jgi:hypothetical protein